MRLRQRRLPLVLTLVATILKAKLRLLVIPLVVTLLRLLGSTMTATTGGLDLPLPRGMVRIRLLL